MPSSSVSRWRSPSSERSEVGELFGSAFLRDVVRQDLPLDARSVVDVAVHLPRHVNIAYMRPRDIVMLDELSRMPNLVWRRWNDEWWCRGVLEFIGDYTTWFNVDYHWDGQHWACRFEYWPGPTLA